MARHKDTVWALPEGESVTCESAQLAVLMDIRDELKALRAIFQCPNFLQVPWTLKNIETNTKRKKKRPVARKRAA
jgi:hypothetical protein